MAGTPAQIARMEKDIATLRADLDAAHAERAALADRLTAAETALALRVQTVERKQGEMRTVIAKRDPGAAFFKRERGKIDRRRRAMRRSRR